jgi:hypothetical protein
MTGELKGIWKEMVIPEVNILESGKTMNKSVTKGGIDIENRNMQTIMLKHYRCTRWLDERESVLLEGI